ncbi:hypothetical protein C7B61_11260 [filamentous cyanobacterium CCP1]|nr:hypothetical protein C7B76_27080 [filamentous cyanobacterium CCP2]PSB65445.1 hypothetical protein C7B61_11260 [filamentous cyanobacterium CCP1]
MMKPALRLVFWLVVSTVTLSACIRSNVTGSAEIPSPVASRPRFPDAIPPLANPTASPSALNAKYTQPDGAFEISFPEGYQYQQTDTGLIFYSEDEAFRGEVVFGSAQGEEYTNEQLEAFLKQAYRTNLNLTEVDWQQTAVQPDGSVRIDWVGKDPGDNVLDAESFIEQRGDTIYILTLSGINTPYVDYLEDAQAIVNSYRVQTEVVQAESEDTQE